jgi:hypothetical protein
MSSTTQGTNCQKLFHLARSRRTPTLTRQLQVALAFFLLGLPLGLLAQRTTWQRRTDFPGVAERESLYFATTDYAYVGKVRGSREFWRYSPANNAWTQMQNHPGIAFQSPSFVIGNVPYVVSGTQVWRYSEASDSWTLTGAIPGEDKRAGFGFAVGTKGYIGEPLAKPPAPLRLRACVAGRFVS